MNITDLKALVLKWEGGNNSKGRNSKDSASKFPCLTPFKDPKDGVVKTGWHTVEGVTYKTWVGVFGRKQDQRWWDMSDEDWFFIFKGRFFDKIGGSVLKSMNVAAVVVDMSFMSGAYEAIETLQEAINDVKGKGTVSVDGGLFRNDGSSKTLEAANTIDPLTLIKALVVRRKMFLKSITDDNTTQEIKNRVFLKGWNNRTDDYLKSYLKGLV